MNEQVPQQWEYRHVTPYRDDEVVVDGVGFVSLEAALNTLGKQGWELIAVEPASVDLRSNSMTERKLAWYLKRQLEVRARENGPVFDRVADTA